MTSLINLLIASFLAMGTPVPAAQAATATQAPPAGRNADAQQKAAFKEMLDETRKINELCTRDHFGKVCIAAQEQFQSKFLKQVPRYDAAAMGPGTVAMQAKQAR